VGKNGSRQEAANHHKEDYTPVRQNTKVHSRRPDSANISGVTTTQHGCGYRDLPASVAASGTDRQPPEQHCPALRQHPAPGSSCPPLHYSCSDIRVPRAINPYVNDLPKLLHHIGFHTIHTIAHTPPWPSSCAHNLSLGYSFHPRSCCPARHPRDSYHIFSSHRRLNRIA
jgi:hypothetical protein